MRSDRMVAVRGIELCVETFGDPADPVLLLLAGSTCSMDWWDTRFCRRLAAGSRFVIRYDQRDTGRSPSYPVGRPGYQSDDLVQNTVGVRSEWPGRTSSACPRAAPSPSWSRWTTRTERSR